VVLAIIFGVSLQQPHNNETGENRISGSRLVAKPNDRFCEGISAKSAGYTRGLLAE